MKVRSHGSCPALRALDGQGWFGLPGIPAAFKKEIRPAYVAWLRTAEACLEMTKSWVISYHILSLTLPTLLTAMEESMSHEDIRWTKVNLRGMVIGFVTYRVHYEHGD